MGVGASAQLDGNDAFPEDLSILPRILTAKRAGRSGCAPVVTGEFVCFGNVARKVWSPSLALRPLCTARPPPSLYGYRPPGSPARCRFSLPRPGRSSTSGHRRRSRARFVPPADGSTGQTRSRFVPAAGGSTGQSPSEQTRGTPGESAGPQALTGPSPSSTLLGSTKWLE